MMTLALAALVSWQPASGPFPAPPGVKVANERVVLGTPAGLIVIALYPEVAPKNVEQVMKLVSAGVYNGTCFPRIDKNFVMQISDAELDRKLPLSAAQKELIKPLPAEFSKLKHVRGVISMARKDGDINSATTSFSILLGPAPHLDDKYTIIGHVEYGMDVVDELVKAPCTKTRPNERLTVETAGLVTHEQLLQRPPDPAIVLFRDAIVNETVLTPEARAGLWHDALLAIGVLLIIGTALVPVFNTKLSPKKVQTVNLMVVLIAVFLLVALLQPMSIRLFQFTESMNLGYVIAILLFFGLLGMFRLMSSFESPS